MHGHMLMMVLEVRAAWGQHPVMPYLFEFKHLVNFLVDGKRKQQ